MGMSYWVHAGEFLGGLFGMPSLLEETAFLLVRRSGIIQQELRFRGDDGVGSIIPRPFPSTRDFHHNMTSDQLCSEGELVVGGGVCKDPCCHLP